MQRLIANLLMYWMLLLVPGATALELARPQVLLPACCRIHGAHHCMATTRAEQRSCLARRSLPVCKPDARGDFAGAVSAGYAAGPGPHFAGGRNTLRGARRVVGVSRRSARIARSSFYLLTRTLR